jgi:hypothetical protein
MASERPQSFQNHARWVPLYHFVIAPILLANLIWSVILLARGPSWPTVLGVLVALALVGLFFFARIFALRVQDRLIRLEMQLRLQRILPPDLGARAVNLVSDQFIALRFASDAELPALVREVLEKNLTDRTEIKRKVRDWQADYLRA